MRHVVFLFILFVLLFVINGCKQKEIIVDNVRTEYINRNDSFFIHDSIFVRDSIVLCTRGESVFVDRWHTRFKTFNVYQTHNDTVLKCDTIRQAPEIVYRDKDLPWYIETLASLGAIFILLVCIIIILFFSRKI